MMIRFLLIGAGRIGRIHAENIARSSRASLVAVADADGKAASDLAERWQCGTVSTDDALALPDIDAVLIASSTDTHADWIERCATAGKAVFCEKPLDLDITRATQCVRKAQQAGIQLYLGFNRRYDPSFARLKRELEAGSIGRLETLHITSRDPAPPPVDYIRRSGGLFRDMMIHDLDMARWLLGVEPVEVFARGSALVDPAIGAAGDVDTAMVMLRTADGRLCQIANSRRCSFGYDQRIEAFGSKGMLLADNHTTTSVTLAASNGFTTEPALPFFLERYADAYRLELDDFITALERKPVQLATAEDGRRALLLADAAQQSLRSGAPVSLEH
jgi:myo-inositol 2-dehydrogenase / D-chiro-inositol 1-dehydrogenase